MRRKGLYEELKDCVRYSYTEEERERARLYLMSCSITLINEDRLLERIIGKYAVYHLFPFGEY